MIEVEAPSSIRVKIPQHAAEPGSDVPMYTELFRESWDLPGLLCEMGERFPDKEELQVVSAASSIGAEADSFLALYTKAGFAGHVCLNGFDLNKLALAQAKQGIYKFWNYHAAEALNRYGFRVELVEEQDADDSEDTMFYHTADSTQVRELHDVTFYHHDITRQLPVRGANLIMINNALHHMSPGAATETVINASKSLTENGILSVGRAGVLRDGHMRYSQMRYEEWLENIPHVLWHVSGLKPIDEDEGLPTRFSRPESH